MDKSFIFNGENSLDYGIIGTPKIPLLPDRRRNTVTIPGRDGEYDFGGNSYPPMILPIDCRFTASTLEGKKEELSQIALWLTARDTKGKGALILGGDLTKCWPNAKLYNQIDLRHIGRKSRFILSFECNPFYLEDIEDISGTVDEATDYGSQFPFCPIITVTMTAGATYVQVTLISTGRYMRINTTLIPNDVIVFDMRKGHITLNGMNADIYQPIGSMPFAVPAGEQQINITTDGTATSEMTYARRYVYA